MKFAIAGIVISALSVSVVGAQSVANMPVHDKPLWQIVTGLPDSPGAAVAARSLSTNEVIGSLPVDSRFQSFGSNGKIMTFSFNGQLAYLPSTAASRLYPAAPKPELAPPGRTSLDTLAQEYEQRMTGDMGVSLSYSDSLEKQTPQIPVNTGVGIAPIASPGYPGANPYGAQPGAALATGGIPAIGAMANPYGGQNPQLMMK